MSVTYNEVRLARKRAYDRVRYELEKRSDTSINVGSAGFTLIPVPKHATQAELDYLYRYFTELRVENVEAYLSYEYEVHGIEKPTSIKNPYAREYRYKKSDEYFSSGYTPDEFFDDYELREQIYSDEADYQSQVEDYKEDYSQDEPEPPEPESTEDKQTAPDYVEYEDLIKQRSFDISPEAGDSVSEALDNIRQQFENIDDMDSYEQGLKDIKNDNYLWGNLQRALKYLESGKEGEAHAEINRALSKVYKHFGMTYYREY